LAILLFISPAGQRKYLFAAVAIVAVVFLSSIWFLKAYVPRTQNVVEALVLRADSLFAGDRLIEDQQRRLCENESALDRIKEHPWLGSAQAPLSITKSVPRSSREVHNSISLSWPIWACWDFSPSSGFQSAI
jgi:hypothetical protein